MEELRAKVRALLALGNTEMTAELIVDVVARYVDGVNEAIRAGAAQRQRRKRERDKSRDCHVTDDVTVTQPVTPTAVSVSPAPPSDPGSSLLFSLSSDPDPERAIPVPPAPEPLPLLVFPCDGTPDFFAVTEEMLKEHSEAYPSLDVLAEYRKALVWVKASPHNRKTARGMGKFLVGWLGRAQNRGGARISSPARASPLVPVRNFKEEATADAFERARAARKQLGGEP